MGIYVMKDKILLIDGHSIVNRAFYGIRPLTNAEGLHTNAIMGFLNIFFNEYAKVKPKYVIVAFDVRDKTFRHEIYNDYKGTRKGMPDELHEQVPVLQEVLTAMGIKICTLPGFEADDILGTYANLASQAGIDAVILSGDRDLLQLASDTTMISIPKTKAGGTEIENYFAQDVIDKYQVTPLEFIDLKALMGDTSDNIPGVQGIGEKTAQPLITKYHSIENLYDHLEEVTPNGAKEKLRNGKEMAELSKVLATININSPVPFDIHDAEIPDESVFYNDRSYELYKKLELRKLLERFKMESVSRPQQEAEYSTANFTSFNDFIKDEDAVGLFAEETLAFIGLAGKKGICIFESADSETTVSALKELFNSGKDIYVYGLKNMLHLIGDCDFSHDNIYDLEIMAYILNPLLSDYSYDLISKDYLESIVPSKADILAKTSISDAYYSLDKKDLAFKVAALSADSAFKAFRAMKDRLNDTEMWRVFADIDMPLAYSLFNMEQTGVRVNRQSLSEFSMQLSDMASELEKDIYEEAGEEFNINSPIQLGNILFDKMKLPHGKKTKKGYSTSADVLEKLAPDFPIVSKILRYRQVVKLRSTYAEGLANYIGEDDRIHGVFNQTITATGRISSTEPNLQNIPIRRAMGQEIRKAFEAREGCVLLDADYSQIELRLLAHMSGDENLINAYKSEADIHKMTASKVFNTPLDQVTKEQRNNAKAVNFGIVYGISSFGLSQDLSISRKQAQEYIEQYFQTYPQVKEYLDRTVREAKLNGFVTTMFGRRRPIPELSNTNFMPRQFGERVAMNSPLQGSAADIMKIAMINVEKALKEAKLEAKIVLQVHDELLVEAPENEIEQVKEILYNEMKNAADTKVPLEVEVDCGRNWLEAH